MLRIDRLKVEQRKKQRSMPLRRWKWIREGLRERIGKTASCDWPTDRKGTSLTLHRAETTLDSYGVRQGAPNTATIIPLYGYREQSIPVSNDDIS